MVKTPLFEEIAKCRGKLSLEDKRKIKRNLCQMSAFKKLIRNKRIEITAKFV